jgi:hypothetical protein
MAVAQVPPADYAGIPSNSTPPSVSLNNATISTGQAGGKTTGDR